MRQNLSKTTSLYVQVSVVKYCIASAFLININQDRWKYLHTYSELRIHDSILHNEWDRDSNFVSDGCCSWNIDMNMPPFVWVSVSSFWNDCKFELTHFLFTICWYLSMKIVWFLYLSMQPVAIISALGWLVRYINKTYCDNVHAIFISCTHSNAWSTALMQTLLIHVESISGASYTVNALELTWMISVPVNVKNWQIRWRDAYFLH